MSASNTGLDTNSAKLPNGSSLHSPLMGNYARQAVQFSRGAGSWLYDDDNREYLDGLCGISVTNLGHAHPAITEAINTQAQKLLHTSNIFHIESQAMLADALCRLAKLDQAFFANSGAEANEAAIKLARLYAHENGNTDPLIITFEGSFHGRTLGMIAATAGDKIKAGFGPSLSGFLHLPFNDIDALERAFAEHDNIAAVLIEPVQGEGGINIADNAFIERVSQLCHTATNAAKPLLILDEIQTGNGRCGSYFAVDQFRAEGCSIEPDIITTAKALGNGLPIGACIARQDVASVFVPGKHGSTFGGNPFCTRVALEVTKQIEALSLDQQVTHYGNKLAEQFNTALAELPWFKEVRQKGLMIGIALNKPCSELVAAGLSKGVIINVTAEKVIRLLPPLIMNDDEAALLAEKVIELVSEFG